MKKTALLLTLTLCSGTFLVAQGPPPGGGFGGPGGFGGGFGGRGPGVLGAGPGPRTVVTGAPYSAAETVTMQQTLQNGNAINRKQQSSVARDGQGRLRTEEAIPANPAANQPARTIITIFDPVAGFQYLLDSSTMTAIQSPLPKVRYNGPPPTPRPPLVNPNPNGPQFATTSLGTQVINGVAAVGTQITETIPAGAIGNAQPIQIVRVTWISSELKVPVQIRTSDPRFGSTDMELTNIAQAEPNASLFVVPAGYTIQQRSAQRGPGGPGGFGQQGQGPGRNRRQPPPQ